MYVSKNHPDYERLTAPRTPAAAPEPNGGYRPDCCKNIL